MRSSEERRWAHDYGHLFYCYFSLFLFSIKVLDGNYEKPTLLKGIFILNIIENKIKELLGAKLLFTDCFAPSPVEALE